MPSRDGDILSKSERFRRQRWLPRFLSKHRTVHSSADANPRTQNESITRIQSEVSVGQIRRDSIRERSEHRSSTATQSRPAVLGSSDAGANAENVDNSGIEMQVLNRSDADATRHGISVKGKGREREATAATLKTRSVSQDNLEVPRQQVQFPNVDDTNLGSQEDMSSPSVLRDITSAPVVNGEPGPSRAEPAANAISSHKGQASASRGHVNTEQSLNGAPSPTQSPERQDATRGDMSQYFLSDRRNRVTKDMALPSTAHDLPIPPKQGSRNSRPDGGPSVTQPQDTSKSAGLPTHKTRNVKERLGKEPQSNQSSQEAFSVSRGKINSRVKLYEKDYKKEHNGAGSNWLIVFESDNIVIKCEDDKFTKSLRKLVQNSDFFKPFGKIVVKHDPDATKTWVSEFSGFLSVPLQSKSNQRFLDGTIGGIILVDGKPFGLTAAHGIYYSEFLKFRESGLQYPDAKRNRESDGTTKSTSVTSKPMMGNREAFTTWDGHSGEVVAYRFSRTLVSTKPFIQNSENLGLSDAADWALVELDGEEIPMNTILGGWLSSESYHGEVTEKPSSEGNAWQMYQDATEELLWRPTQSETTPRPVLIENILTEKEFRREKTDKDLDRVPCVLVTPSSVINGFLGWGHSTFSMYEASFSVLRVDLQSPLGEDSPFYNHFPEAPLLTTY